EKARQLLPHLSRKAVYVHEADADSAIGLDATEPVGLLHVDRMEADTATLRVLDERRRVIEPHRLVVEERRVERGWEMRFQIGARVGQQREAGRVRIGRVVQRA